MKALTNKLLAIAIFIGTLVIFAPSSVAQSVSQLEEKLLPVGQFSSISVTDDFDITIIKGSYSVRLTTEKVLAPYIQVYVRGKVLYITYDSKSVPKDIKKLYKGKNVPNPVFRAVVSLPELNGITLEDNATVTATEEFDGGSFTLSLQDKAQVKNLRLHCTSAQMTLKKNSQATIDMVCDQKAEMTTEGNSVLKMTLNTADAVFTTSNSSAVTLSGEARTFTLNTGGSSKILASEKAETATLALGGSSSVSLSGTTDILNYSSEKSAEADISNYVSRAATVNMTGGKGSINVTEELAVSLTGGSVLNYVGTPTFKIEKVIKSTLAPLGVTK